MAEDINLGDKIVLKGFSDEEGSTMIIIKKMVGNYVKKIMDEIEGFNQASVTLKKVHSHKDESGNQVGGKNEIHIMIDAGKVKSVEVTEHNLFIGIDKAFKKISAAL